MYKMLNTQRQLGVCADLYNVEFSQAILKEISEFGP